jgi:hypothetical protein
MSLFPEENVSTKEMESWRSFADSLKTDEEKKLFVEMLGKCQKYALAHYSSIRAACSSVSNCSVPLAVTSFRSISANSGLV